MVPDCLNQEAEILSALSEAERLKGNLLSASRKVKDCSFSVQLKYLDEQIDDLSLQLDRKRNETAKIYKLLRKNKQLCLCYYKPTLLMWYSMGRNCRNSRF